MKISLSKTHQLLCIDADENCQIWRKVKSSTRDSSIAERSRYVMIYPRGKVRLFKTLKDYNIHKQQMRMNDARY